MSADPNRQVPLGVSGDLLPKVRFRELVAALGRPAVARARAEDRATFRRLLSRALGGRVDRASGKTCPYPEDELTW